LIDDARAHGARIIEVGHRPGEASRRPHTLAPTVVLGVTDDMRIAHEEIFGPILPIFPYRDIDDAIGYVNARPRSRSTTSATTTQTGAGCSYDLRQRHHQRHDHACRAGRSPVRRRRRERDGQVPRDRGLPDTQPPQGHLRAGSRWNSTRLLRAPSASVPMLSSTSSFDDLAGGHRRRRRLPP